MITFPRTTPIDFTTEGSQRILGGDQSRVWIQFTNNSLSQIGVDYVQQAVLSDCAFVINGLDNLILTKGDLGSIIGAPMFGCTGPPTPVVLLVTEVLLVS